MDFKTTTRPRRNLDLLARARALIAPPDADKPLRILEIGPGLAVRYLGRMAAKDMPGSGAFKLVETVLRRLPLPDGAYENYETAELLEAFAGWPVRLTLLDINPRALRIVQAGVKGTAETVVADLSIGDPAALSLLKGGFDLVLALAVLGRIDEGRARENAAANVVSLARADGIIVENTGALDSVAGLTLADRPSIYRKT